MRYYLDTTSLRKLSSKLHMFKGENVFTSSLALVELISGMTESEFNLRKQVIHNVVHSGIGIDWDSYKMKMYKAVDLHYDDIESFSLREMIQIIFLSSSLWEIRNSRIYITSSDYYTLESFSGLDRDLNMIGISTAKTGIQEWRKILSKKHRRYINNELFDKEGLRAYVNSLAEISCSEFIEEITNTRRPSDKYFSALNKYRRRNSMDLFFHCTQLQYNLAQLKGEEYKMNDTIDLLHTIFLSQEDIIVSDDKIFRKLHEWHPNLKTCTVDEFLAKQDF